MKVEDAIESVGKTDLVNDERFECKTEPRVLWHVKLESLRTIKTLILRPLNERRKLRILRRGPE